MSDDRFLRNLFAAASREDSVAAPPFRPPRRRDPHHAPALDRGRLGRAAFAALVIVLAVTVAYLRRTDPMPAPAPVTEQFLSHARWEGPTDFLLATPGAELFHSTPQIGAPPPFADGSSEPEKGTRT